MVLTKEQIEVMKKQEQEIWVQLEENLSIRNMTNITELIELSITLEKEDAR